MSEKDKINAQVDAWQKGIDWESPSCNYCGNSENPFYQETEDNRFHGRTLRLVKCPVCGLIYADPRPTTESYMEVYKTLWAEESRRFKYKRHGVESWHRNIILMAKEYKKDAKTLFDVGTGSGTILIAGRRLKIKVAGNDLNLPTIKWLRKRGYEVYNQPTNKLRLKQKYDLMFCLDYIEHTNTPFDDLKWMAAHTVKGGVLYLKTMYLDSLEYDKQGTKWHMLSGFHTHYFYKGVLRKMIQDVGFKIVYQRLNPEIIHIIARNT